MPIRSPSIRSNGQHEFNGTSLIDVSDPPKKIEKIARCHFINVRSLDKYGVLLIAPPIRSSGDGKIDVLSPLGGITPGLASRIADRPELPRANAKPW